MTRVNVRQCILNTERNGSDGWLRRETMEEIQGGEGESDAWPPISQAFVIKGCCVLFSVSVTLKVNKTNSIMPNSTGLDCLKVKLVWLYWGTAGRLPHTQQAWLFICVSGLQTTQISCLGRSLIRILDWLVKPGMQAQLCNLGTCLNSPKINEKIFFTIPVRFLSLNLNYKKDDAGRQASATSFNSLARP